jgi:NAD(P)-dependent dehydrogenase (short-subunit alcohol dehydrogenase family)
MATSVRESGGRAARGAVLVTGAPTGIGRATALHLETLGFDVFAGVRREEDRERLAADSSGRCVPVLCDITDQAAIDDFRNQLEVNLVGHVAVTQAMLPRYVVGTDARIQIALASVLPDRTFDAVTRRLLGA